MPRVSPGSRDRSPLSVPQVRGSLALAPAGQAAVSLGAGQACSVTGQVPRAWAQQDLEGLSMLNTVPRGSTGTTEEVVSLEPSCLSLSPSPCKMEPPSYLLLDANVQSLPAVSAAQWRAR